MFTVHGQVLKSRDNDFQEAIDIHHLQSNNTANELYYYLYSGVATGVEHFTGNNTLNASAAATEAQGLLAQDSG